MRGELQASLVRRRFKEPISPIFSDISAMSLFVSKASGRQCNYQTTFATGTAPTPPACQPPLSNAVCQGVVYGRPHGKCPVGHLVGACDFVF